MRRFIVWCLAPALSFMLVNATMATVGFNNTSATNTLVTLPKDIVLVLDNSGSMKNNDPKFLVKDTIARFIRSAPVDMRVAIVVFDEYAVLAVPLTTLSADNLSLVLASLDQINYRGQFTNTVAAVEQAIYELKLNSRAEAAKLIILLTDGFIDTGNKAFDLRSAEWLQKELVDNAARNAISIFGIALGKRSDLQLLQSLAERTHGVSFQAQRAKDMPGIFEQIGQLIARPAAHPKTTKSKSTVPEKLPPPSAAATVVSPASVSQPKPTTTTSGPLLRQPKDVTSVLETKRSAPTPLPIPDLASKPIIYLLTGISLLLLLLIIVVIWLVIQNRKGSQVRGQVVPLQSFDEPAPRAFLYDLSGITGSERNALTDRVTAIGRIPPEPEEQIDHLIIDRPTIGRRHAIIKREHHGFWLIDLKSKNGTFVNGQRVTEPTCLTHGDRIRLHNFEFEFVLTGMELADETIAISDLKLLTGKAPPSRSSNGSTESPVAADSKPIPSDHATEVHGPINSIVEQTSTGTVEDSILDVTLPRSSWPKSR